MIFLTNLNVLTNLTPHNMFYLIWSVLNAVILLYFFYLLIGFIVKGRRIFQGKLMPVSVTIVALGVVHMVSAALPEEKNNEIFVTEDYSKQSETRYKRVVLEENLALDIALALEYSVENGKVIPVQTDSNLYGFVLGFDWNLVSFDTIGIEENGRSDFEAIGDLEWNLFGFNIYTQEKRFTGKLF